MGKTHYGGMYTGQTVEEVVADIVAGTGVTVSIKTVFLAYKLYGWAARWRPRGTTCPRCSCHRSGPLRDQRRRSAPCDQPVCRASWARDSENALSTALSARHLVSPCDRHGAQMGDGHGDSRAYLPGLPVRVISSALTSLCKPVGQRVCHPGEQLQLRKAVPGHGHTDRDRSMYIT